MNLERLLKGLLFSSRWPLAPLFVAGLLGVVAGCGGKSAPPDAAPPAGATAPAGDLPPADGTPVVTDDAPPTLPSVLDVVIEPHTGDLDEIVRRRQVRMLVTADRTHFYFDGGRQRGIVADAIVEFERWLNVELKSQKHLNIQAVIVPVRRDQLIPALLSGRGDVIATPLTETLARLTQVAFAPGGTPVSEVLVTHTDVPAPGSLDELAGQAVYVRRASSYYESLVELNAQLVKARRPPVDIRLLDDSLDTAEALEMVNAGVIPATLADRYVAKLWAGVLPGIRVHEDIRLREDTPLAWAVRPDSPQLLALVGRFQKATARGTLWGNMKVREYFATGRFIRNPDNERDRERLREARLFFDQFGSKYSLDWLLIAAQAYQESGLDHSRRSHVGAIDIMQVMPATARDPRVGIPDIEKLDRNIEAGTKYLRFVIDHYYKDEPMTALDKELFALASYNAGPARVAKLRAEAERIGLDPNMWFQNVEVVAARRIGAETVTYVRNIYKYYLIYKLLEQQSAIRPPPAAAPG